MPSPPAGHGRRAGVSPGGSPSRRVLERRRRGPSSLPLTHCLLLRRPRRPGQVAGACGDGRPRVAACARPPLPSFLARPVPSPGSHTYGPRLEMWAPGLGGVGSSAEAPPVHAGGRSEACIFLACDWQNPLLTEGSGSPPETKCTLKPAACAARPRGRWVCAVSPRGAPPLMDCVRRPPRMRLPSERRPRVCPVRVLWGRHGMCWKP